MTHLKGKIKHAYSLRDLIQTLQPQSHLKETGFQSVLHQSDYMY